MTFPETSQRNPVGSQPRPVESGQQPEASLAWASKTATAKRRQRRCTAMRLSPEISLVGVLAVSQCGDRGEASQRPDALAPAGVGGAWGASNGVPQEQERPVLSARRIGSSVVPNPKRPGPRSRVADRRERNLATPLAVSRGEPHEPREKEKQESECPHSTETRRRGLSLFGEHRRAN